MNEQVMVNVTMYKDIKESAETLFNNAGISLSDAINAFLRKSVEEQAVPTVDYADSDDYFSPEMMASLEEAERNFERGDCIYFTMEELLDMGTGGSGKIPQRGIDFLKKHGRTKYIKEDLA